MTRADLVLVAIKDHWGEYVVPPTIRAVQDVTGINSTSQIRYYYKRLERRGLIKRVKGKPVPIEIYQLLHKEFRDENRK
jgi:SOS-response transcriptional repressor LexA